MEQENDILLSYVFVAGTILLLVVLAYEKAEEAKIFAPEPRKVTLEELNDG